jgi:hypothetical protein
MFFQFESSFSRYHGHSMVRFVHHVFGTPAPSVMSSQGTTGTDERAFFLGGESEARGISYPRRVM